MNQGEITGLLQQWSAGEAEMLPEIMTMAHDELRKAAAGQLKRESSSATLTPTSLVNEAFIRIARLKGPQFNNRKHFYAMAALLMRHVLVEVARKRSTVKRDGSLVPLDVETIVMGKNSHPLDLLALDEALSRLGQRDVCQLQVVELRFFGGFSVKEVAHLMGRSIRSVENDWTMAKAWLFSQLTQEVAHA